RGECKAQSPWVPGSSEAKAGSGPGEGPGAGPRAWPAGVRVGSQVRPAAAPATIDGGNSAIKGDTPQEPQVGTDSGTGQAISLSPQAQQVALLELPIETASISGMTLEPVRQGLWAARQDPKGVRQGPGADAKEELTLGNLNVTGSGATASGADTAESVPAATGSGSRQTESFASAEGASCPTGVGWSQVRGIPEGEEGGAKKDSG
ncbi:unnamed protein product, partial [Discosporangium mesarthrocarpum]